MQSTDIVKAGWMYRQSTVMHRWKKHWFVLNRAGDLQYFEMPDSAHPEERIVVRAAVIDVRAGEECKASPPDGHGKNCLLELKMREGSDLRLCAESADDMKAWQMVINEARVVPMGPTPPVVPLGTQITYPFATSHGGYGGQVLAMPGQTQYVVQNAAGGVGQTVYVGNPGPSVVYMNEPRHTMTCYHDRRCRRYPDHARSCHYQNSGLYF